jgi:hypothetical protein
LSNVWGYHQGANHARARGGFSRLDRNTTNCPVFLPPTFQNELS